MASTLLTPALFRSPSHLEGDVRPGTRALTSFLARIHERGPTSQAGWSARFHKRPREPLARVRCYLSYSSFFYRASQLNFYTASKTLNRAPKSFKSRVYREIVGARSPAGCFPCWNLGYISLSPHFFYDAHYSVSGSQPID